jgi:hypothetical protein
MKLSSANLVSKTKPLQFWGKPKIKILIIYPAAPNIAKNEIRKSNHNV